MAKRRKISILKYKNPIEKLEKTVKFAKLLNF